MRTVLVTSDIPDDFEMNKRLTTVNAEEGQALFRKKGCLACHQIGKEGGAVGPSFSQVGSRLCSGYIFMHVKNPQKMVPGAVEPMYNMSDEEVLKITKFLTSLRSGIQPHL